ncbi:protein-L-isoaspartate O-methyltransferase [Chelatococcus reniformis]|uniref:Protein-L-isoaspartate O-methyltransferase n=2 Tax=Chelatococcus reniformis TaxID=1494448 RepID=A0A916XFE7_9HYPH|nr:protein-L-isoaspartate O-methyltransferase [Chelatococcus reniformis]
MIPPGALDLPSSQREETAAFLLSLRSKGIRDIAVLRAMEKVPRDLFAPRRFADLARADIALPLPCGQTMTAPAQIAVMLRSLGVEPHHRVLEVGTGSGYVAAVLGHLGGEVISLERMRTLAIAAVERIATLGMGNLMLEQADGLAAGTAFGRFDRILLNGSVEQVPPQLIAALAEGGRLVVAQRGVVGVRMLCVMCHGAANEEQLGEPLRLPPLVPGLAEAL